MQTNPKKKRVKVIKNNKEVVVILPYDAEFITLPSGREVYRRGCEFGKGDLRLSEKKAKFYYSLIEEVILFYGSTPRRTALVHCLLYGTILENILRTILKHNYIQNSNPKSLNKVFDDYLKEYKAETMELGWIKRDNQSEEITKFIEDLCTLNQDWNAGKHEIKADIEKARLCLRYLLDFIYYVSNVPLTSQIKEHAYKGTLYYDTISEIEDQEKAYNEQYPKGFDWGSHRQEYLEELVVEQDGVQTSTEGGKSSLSVKGDVPPLVQNTLQKRMPILFYFDVSITRLGYSIIDALLHHIADCDNIEFGITSGHWAGWEEKPFALLDKPIEDFLDPIEETLEKLKGRPLQPISIAPSIERCLLRLKRLIEDSPYQYDKVKLFVITACKEEEYISLEQLIKTYSGKLHLDWEMEVWAAHLYDYFNPPINIGVEEHFEWFKAMYSDNIKSAIIKCKQEAGNLKLYPEADNLQ